MTERAPSRWGQGHAPPAVLAELRAARLARGLTQKDAAAILGIAPVTVSIYETGHGNVTEARIRELIEQLNDQGGGNGQMDRPAVAVRAVAHPAAAPPASEALPAAPAVQAHQAAPVPGPSLLRYVPAPQRTTPKLKVRTCPLPRGAIDENEACICGSPRKRHDALKFSCQDCRKGSSGCQYFRPASRFGSA